MTTKNIVGPYAIYRYVCINTRRWIYGYTTDLLRRIYYYAVDAIENKKVTASGLYDDIRRFGTHRFFAEIIQDGIATEEEAKDRELWFIAQDINRGIRLYNCEGTTRVGYPPVARSNPYVNPPAKDKVAFTIPGRSVHGRRLSAEGKDLMFYLHERGWNPYRIAKHLGVSGSAVCRYVHGRPRYVRTTLEMREAIRKQYATGEVTQAAVARKFGISQGRVSQICKPRQARNKLMKEQETK